MPNKVSKAIFSGIKKDVSDYMTKNEGKLFSRNSVSYKVYDKMKKDLGLKERYEAILDAEGMAHYDFAEDEFDAIVKGYETDWLKKKGYNPNLVLYSEYKAIQRAVGNKVPKMPNNMKLNRYAKF